MKLTDILEGSWSPPPERDPPFRSPEEETYKGVKIETDQDGDGFMWISYTPELKPEWLNKHYNKDSRNAIARGKLAIDVAEILKKGGGETELKKLVTDHRMTQGQLDVLFDKIKRESK